MTPRPPIVHFAAGKGWRPGTSRLLTACGEYVIVERVTRECIDVTCRRCMMTNAWLDAADEAKDQAIKEALRRV